MERTARLWRAEKATSSEGERKLGVSMLCGVPAWVVVSVA